MRYRAFISYSHADAVAAAWLHRKLEGWRVPRRMRADNPALPDKLAPVFRDREELGSAGELGPQIQAAMADSEALIVLCSPQAAQSRWVDTEVRAFRASGRGDRVFALIVDGEPHSGDERECFPPSLRESEPLAADLRPGKDGKELALLKLIAGLLGVPLDTLRQREARRRHQRMLAVTSLALVVMLVTSVLAVQASIARAAAERRQKQAEALVDFMLGDLNDKLSEVARLDILEGVHDHAMAYFQSLPEDDVTDAALVKRARAFKLIGNVRMDQGRLDKAREAYLAAERLSGRLAKDAPQRLDRQLEYADNLAYLGIAGWYQGNLDEAQRRFDQSQAVLVRAQSLAPEDTTLLFQFSTLDNNAGHVVESRGRIEDATVHYRRMLVASRKLVAKDASNITWQNQLGLAYNNLAKMALLEGDLAGAVAGYRADVEVETVLAARDPRNNQQAERLLLSRAALGRTLALAGELDEGARLMQLSLDQAERLSALEPDSSLFLEDRTLYATQLARLRRLQGQMDSSAALVARAQQAVSTLLAKDPGNPGWQRERAETLLEHGEQQLAARNSDAARTSLDAALAIMEPQFVQQADDRGLLLATLTARLRRAALEPVPAAGLRSSLAACDAQASGKRDPRLRALQAELLLRLDSRERAQALAAELWQSGFRDAGFADWLRQNAIAVTPPPAAKLAGRGAP